MTQKSSIKTGHIRHVVKYRFLRYASPLLASIILLGLTFSVAVSANAFISQSYTTTDQLSLGSIVGLRNNSPDQVVASATTNVDSLLGVVINAANSPLSLSSGQENQVQVATSGTLRVLVSDINGTIVRGDHITASPISGVGMKATGNVRIVGVAQGDLVMTTDGQQSYIDKSGRSQSVVLGEVPVLVNVSYYFKEPDKTIIPSALQNVANTIVGKTVSTLPILISAAIFVVTIIVVASIVYSMIRSSIISVGRNPMSQSAVYRDVIQLSGLVLVILAVSVIAMYLVLTRL